MNKREIIDGYKGIMELDLTDIPENLKKCQTNHEIR